MLPSKSAPSPLQLADLLPSSSAQSKGLSEAAPAPEVQPTAASHVPIDIFAGLSAPKSVQPTTALHVPIDIFAGLSAPKSISSPSNRSGPADPAASSRE